MKMYSYRAYQNKLFRQEPFFVLFQLLELDQGVFVFFGVGFKHVTDLLPFNLKVVVQRSHLLF